MVIELSGIDDKVDEYNNQYYGIDGNSDDNNDDWIITTITLIKVDHINYQFMIKI